MIPEPCKLSKAISERRKAVRFQLNAWHRVWNERLTCTNDVRDCAFINLVRQAHILRMDFVPKVYPDGRPFDKVSRAWLAREKRASTRKLRR